MECVELIEQMLKEPDQHTEEHTDKSLDKHRERLAALVAGGKCSQYLGENYTMEKIDNMTDEEIKKLYTSYESRLGATMTKTIGSAMLQLYTVIASTFLPIPAKMITKATPPKLDFNGYGIGMIILDIGLAMATSNKGLSQKT